MARLMVSGGVSQGVKSLAILMPLRSKFLIPSLLWLARTTVQPSTLLRDKRAFISSGKGQVFGVEDPEKHSSKCLWNTCVCGYFLLYLTLIYIYIPD